MKKKFSIFKSLCILFALIPCLLCFSACSNNGKSAYELAVEQGFSGTLDEWLASLKGDKGDAGENGINGTNGTNGLNGTNGTNSPSQNSPYDLYLKAKELGEFNGTFVEFVRDVLKITTTDENVVINNKLASIVSIKASLNSGLSNMGSGVIYSIDESYNAFIITNYHVCYATSTGRIYDNFTLNLYGNDESKEFSATFVGGSKTYDLAVLYVSASNTLKEYNAEAVTINTDDTIESSKCFAIGNSNGSGISITTGCISVSSEERTLTSGGKTCPHRLIRHDAYITGGNSGGGLFNSSGELIGITNGGLKASSTNGESNSIKFAIPASVVKGVADNIIKYCYNTEETMLNVVNLGFTYNITDSKTASNGTFITTTETISITGFDPDIHPSINLQSGDKIISMTLVSGSDETKKSITRIHHADDFVLLLDNTHTLKLELSRTGEVEPVIVTIDLSELTLSKVV